MVNSNINFSEMSNLFLLMCDADIPFDFEELFGGFHLMYPSRENTVCSVILHDYSYGSESGLLEIMGLIKDDIDDDVEGYLSAADVFLRIKKHYNLEG